MPRAIWLSLTVSSMLPGGLERTTKEPVSPLIFDEDREDRLVGWIHWAVYSHWKFNSKWKRMENTLILLDWWDDNGEKKEKKTHVKMERGRIMANSRRILGAAPLFTQDHILIHVSSHSLKFFLFMSSFFSSCLSLSLPFLLLHLYKILKWAVKSPFSMKIVCFFSHLFFASILSFLSNKEITEYHTYRCLLFSLLSYLSLMKYTTFQHAMMNDHLLIYQATRK